MFVVVGSDCLFQERGMDCFWCIVFQYAVMSGLEC